MEYEKAKAIAMTIQEKLKDCCSQIEIAGSIRRRKEFCHDIDMVCIPSNQGQLLYQLQSLGKITMGKQKLIRVDLNGHAGFPLDLYIATPEIWSTLLLIRTGSKEHNIYLCRLALQRGMKLHADGTGLYKGDQRIAGDTEASIFEALGIRYKEPGERK